MTKEDASVNWQNWLKNNRTLAGLLGGLVALFLVIWAVEAAFKRPSAPVPAAMPKGGAAFQVVGFYENKVAGDGIPSSRVSFDAHYRQLTSVSPLWFSVNTDGTVSDTGYDNSLVTDAHSHHISVVPLFTNAQGSTNVLWSAATRLKAAKSIAAVVKQDHLDGANIDFELLNPASRTDLSDFVYDLSQQLHPMHKVVAVSVFPLVGLPASINGAYDYHALAQNADYLVLMAYDHHYSGGPPGPVASYGWVQQNVAAALKQAPAKRLVLSIGMYGYDWVNNGAAGAAATVPDVTAKQMASRYGARIRYIASESQNEFTYSQSGVAHVVWFMGDRSAKARVALARQYHLAGVSLWRLGMEDPQFWSNVP
jgi:spore germination protein YaaH